MKWFVDGDQMVIVRDDFVDLQESPAVFLPLESEKAQVVLEVGIAALPMKFLVHIFDSLGLGVKDRDGGD